MPGTRPFCPFVRCTAPDGRGPFLGPRILNRRSPPRGGLRPPALPGPSSEPHRPSRHVAAGRMGPARVPSSRSSADVLRLRATRGPCSRDDPPPPRSRRATDVLRSLARVIMCEMVVRRVAVIGSPGSGKSTVARRLGERLALPVVHLDQLFWRPGWVESSMEEFRELHAAVIGRDAWVVDGNYESGDQQARLARADAIVVLDASGLGCL